MAAPEDAVASHATRPGSTRTADPGLAAPCRRRPRPGWFRHSRAGSPATSNGMKRIAERRLALLDPAMEPRQDGSNFEHFDVRGAARVTEIGAPCPGPRRSTQR